MYSHTGLLELWHLCCQPGPDLHSLQGVSSVWAYHVVLLPLLRLSIPGLSTCSLCKLISGTQYLSQPCLTHRYPVKSNAQRCRLNYIISREWKAPVAGFTSVWGRLHCFPETPPCFWLWCRFYHLKLLKISHSFFFSFSVGDKLDTRPCAC